MNSDARSGSLVAGRIVAKFGRKRVTILGIILAGLGSILYLNVPTFWLSYSIHWLAVTFDGVRFTASNSLALEQVPKVRSSMMSINSASEGVGAVVGASLGGIILLIGDWTILGMLIGIFYAISAIARARSGIMLNGYSFLISLLYGYIVLVSYFGSVVAYGYYQYKHKRKVKAS
ncbi:MAG: MFS transporter [Candidatus Bathyarchaeota archaeon]|nr:MFS transporter [Candidatus Bathyarchaeota archaeon]